MQGSRPNHWVRDHRTVTSVRRGRGLTRTPFILNHVRLTSRTFWTSWVSVTTIANRCRPLLCKPPANLRRLRRLGRYLLGAQKLGFMIRKSDDPKHLDACTDADWSGDSIDRKNTSGGIFKLGSATLREFTKGQICQTLSSGESEYNAAVTTTAEALHHQRLLEFLANAGEAPTENRFDSGPWHHPEARRRTSQAH